MRKIAVASFLSVLALGLSGGNPVRASAEIGSAGPYVAISGVMAFLLSVDESAHDAGLDAEAGLSGGLGVRGGYRLGQWLSAEGELEWIRHEVDLSGGPVSVNVEGDTYSLTGGAKLHLVSWENGEFYASSGVGFMLFDPGEETPFTPGDETSFVARFGAGVDIYTDGSMGVSVGATYVLPTGGLDELDYVGAQVGVFFRFE